MLKQEERLDERLQQSKSALSSGLISEITQPPGAKGKVGKFGFGALKRRIVGPDKVPKKRWATRTSALRCPKQRTSSPRRPPSQGKWVAAKEQAEKNRLKKQKEAALKAAVLQESQIDAERRAVEANQEP